MCPGIRTPAATRASTLQRASAPYPWFVVPGGTASPPSRSQLFLAGSTSGVTVTSGGECVLSTTRTAAFHVPNTAFGGIAVWPLHSLRKLGPDCQSQALLSGSEV